MKYRNSVCWWIVLLWTAMGFVSELGAQGELETLVQQYEAASKRLQEPLESLRESYLKHLERLQKELGADGDLKGVANVRAAAKVGDPDPGQQSETPKLREAQTRFMAEKKKRLEVIKQKGEGLLETYIKQLEKLQMKFTGEDEKAAVAAAMDRVKKRPVAAKPVEKVAPEFVDNFSDEWPNAASTDTSAKVIAVREDKEAKVFVYHSTHFEFVSDARLSLNVIRKLSRLFEATLAFCKALPISTQKAHITGAKRHRIELFREESDYFKNGGLPGSAGVFISGRNVVMVPLKHVGVLPAGSGFRVDYDKQNKTLAHEIAHQLTDVCYSSSGSRGWFTEGLAEYVGLTPYSNSGTYKVRGNRDPIAKGVTAYGEDGSGGRALGEEIHMGMLSSWMKMPYSEFTGPEIGKNYGVAALVVYYFFHMDGDGDRKAINGFLRALRAGKRGQEALDVLLLGRTWDQLAADISKGWSSRRITINWAAED